MSAPARRGMRAIRPNFGATQISAITTSPNGRLGRMSSTVSYVAKPFLQILLREMN